MGKSRKHKHVDRNAYRNFGSGAPGHGPKGLDRRAQVALITSRPTAADFPPAVDSAIPLPDLQETLVLLRKPPPIPPDYRSRYPAKKTKRAKWVEPLSPPHPPVEPVATVPIAAPEPREKPPETDGAPSPLLLLAYQPVEPTVPPEPRFDEPLPTDEEIILLEPTLWIDDVFLAPKRAAAPVFDTPTPEMVRAAGTPLPRRAAVTAWRKSGPFDAIGHWLRTRAWQLAVLVAPKTKRKPTELARLRAENRALRRQLNALEQLRV